MAKYIVAHDVGTSGNKAVLVDTEGRVACLTYATVDASRTVPDSIYTKHTYRQGALSPLPFFDQRMHHGRVSQGGYVAQVIDITGCNFGQNSPHDLATPGLG